MSMRKSYNLTSIDPEFVLHGALVLREKSAFGFGELLELCHLIRFCASKVRISHREDAFI